MAFLLDFGFKALVTVQVPFYHLVFFPSMKHKETQGTVSFIPNNPPQLNSPPN